ncbi:MAG: hypothetical protein KTR31_40160 [Myxococcales bacterium]|nr:hypothetical protein [Myxococcales bacterium]
MIVFTLSSAMAGTLTVPTQYTTLEEAVDEAASGDTIVIESGSYDTSVIVRRDLTVEGREGVTLRGHVPSYVIKVLEGAELTLRQLDFDGQGDRRCLQVQDASTLIVEDSSFAGCTASVGGAIISQQYGKEAQGSVTVRRSVFRDAGGIAEDGGHISVTRAAAVTVEDSHFAGGDVEGLGGALRIGAVDVVTVSGSTFESNTAQTGGALHASNFDHANVQGNLFCVNQASGDGGAVFLQSTGSSASATVTGNVFSRNSSLDGRGGALFANVRDNTSANLHFLGNAGSVGSALFSDGAASYRNLLLMGNAGDGAVIEFGESEPKVDYALLHDNDGLDPEVGIGNTLLADPLLEGPTGCEPAGFVPAPDSPVVDAGDPELTDVDGSRSDIGAFGGASPFLGVDRDGDGDPFPYDCDDEDGQRFAGASEACNGVDDDCDGQVPDDELDVDDDGLSACAGDCDDSSITVGPHQVELTCDGVDNDCDAETLDAPAGDCDVPGGDSPVVPDGAEAAPPGAWFCGSTGGSSAPAGAALALLLLVGRRRG